MLFRSELDKFIDIDKYQTDSKDKFFRFEMISNEGQVKPRLVKLNSDKEIIANQLESKINSLLSGDTDIDMYALLAILKKKING